MSRNLTVRVEQTDLRIVVAAAQYAQRIYTGVNGHPIPELDDAVARVGRWLDPLTRPEGRVAQFHGKEARRGHS